MALAPRILLKINKQPQPETPAVPPKKLALVVRKPTEAESVVPAPPEPAPAPAPPPIAPASAPVKKLALVIAKTTPLIAPAPAPAPDPPIGPTPDPTHVPPVGKRILLPIRKPQSENDEVPKQVAASAVAVAVPKKLIIKGANQIAVYRRLVVGNMYWVDETNTRIFSEDLDHIIAKVVDGEIVWEDDHNITLNPHVSA